MGHPLKLLMGPVSVGATGTHTFTYTHPVDVHASLIDAIQGEILSGTQTGVVAFNWGNAVGMTREIYRTSLTAADPAACRNPKRVIYPGQVVEIAFSAVTAGDVVQASIGGH